MTASLEKKQVSIGSFGTETEAPSLGFTVPRPPGQTIRFSGGPTVTIGGEVGGSVG